MTFDDEPFQEHVGVGADRGGLEICRLPLGFEAHRKSSPQQCGDGGTMLRLGRILLPDEPGGHDLHALSGRPGMATHAEPSHSERFHQQATRQISLLPFRFAVRPRIDVGRHLRRWHGRNQAAQKQRRRSVACVQHSPGAGQQVRRGLRHPPQRHAQRPLQHQPAQAGQVLFDDIRLRHTDVAHLSQHMLVSHRLHASGDKQAIFKISPTFRTVSGRRRLPTTSV